jgi:hypothetical protein
MEFAWCLHASFGRNLTCDGYQRRALSRSYRSRRLLVEWSFYILKYRCWFLIASAHQNCIVSSRENAPTRNIRCGEFVNFRLTLRGTGRCLLCKKRGQRTPVFAQREKADAPVNGHDLT